MKGVVAAGHPLTAEAGARVLAEGGNAVDAACASMLMSWVTESPLTGPGAGGFMLVHTASGEDHLLDFFVAAPSERGGDLQPIDIHFSEEVVQVFNVGVASNGVPGTPLGVAEALARFGSVPLADLVREPARLAREGLELNSAQGHLHEILGPIYETTPEARAIYEPEGRPLRAGERLVQPELGDLLERIGAEGPSFIYDGSMSLGQVTAEDLRSYRVIERAPARARYHGRDILTNPPPSSGGILIAMALDMLEEMGEQGDRFPRAIVEVMDRANEARTPEFYERLGSTTHLCALDSEGTCATTTCSNGSGSGVVLPGTGIHLNNMLGEEDLNPMGFGRYEPGARVSSMMAPTVVLREGEVEVALGSAGSNRIRSAILQTALNVIDGELDAQAAVDRHRMHVEGRVLDVEPGVADWLLAEMEAEDWTVQRWPGKDLYFGGVQAVASVGGTMSGGGDPRRGGVTMLVD